MIVRAKFRVESVTKDSFGHSFKLVPVSHGSPENEAFYKQTPGGSMTLSTVNPAIADQFIPDAEFYVDFTKAD